MLTGRRQPSTSPRIRPAASQPFGGWTEASATPSRHGLTARSCCGRRRRCTANSTDHESDTPGGQPMSEASTTGQGARVPPASLLVLAFIAGSLAVPLFHQPMLASLHALGVTPATPYAM